MVDKTLSTPLYRQVYNALARDIENGVYPLATPLPPERELSTMFGVDRITIRRALDILSTAGMVVRKPGSGTYVQSTCVKADEPQPVPDTGWRYLGFIMPTDESFGLRINNPFHATILSVIEEECTKHKFHLIFKILGQGESLREFVASSHICGLIFSSYADESILHQTRALGVPAVIVNHISNEITSVGIDNFAGAYDITKYLLSLGHRRIGVITGMPSYQTYQERIGGYRKAMQESGLDPAQQPILEGNWRFESGYQQAKKLLGDYASDLPTALFCMNDTMAYGALKAFAESGLEVPKQISVAGFDGIENEFPYTPTLTTAKVDIISIGKLAIRNLLNSIDDTDYSVKIIVPVKLEIGDSTAAYHG